MTPVSTAARAFEPPPATASGPRALLLAAALLFQAGPVPAQTVSFKISPPAVKPRLSEPFQLRLELTGPADYAVKPDTSTFSNDVFELLKIERTSSKTAGPLRTEAFNLRVSAFSIGVSTFPETAWLMDNGAERKEVRSPSFQLEIMPLFDEKTEPEGIRDIRPPFRFIPWLWLLIGMLAAAMAGWLLYRRFAGRGISAGAVAVPDTRSAYEKASGALAELDASGLWEEGRIKEFYSRLTDIFSSYLDAQFGIKAELMTTNRITRELRRTGAGIKTVILTRELLERSDLAKFAKLKPGDRDRDADVSALRDLLLSYSQKTESEPAPAAPGVAAGGTRP
jgi:hypothetical protein